jgi:hypothetical protein
MPRNLGAVKTAAAGYTREVTPRGVPTDSATENKLPSFVVSRATVKVKRWGKSPPLQAQARRHGKPHRVQGQIEDRGAARSYPANAGSVPGTGC